VKLDLERAQKLNDLRVRLCAALGKDNEICDPSNLWKKALDLLLAHEAALLAKVEYFDGNQEKSATDPRNSSMRSIDCIGMKV
jgi:hypothetical protein